MCNTCCAVGVVAIYYVQQFVFVTFVVNSPCGKLGVGGKTILKTVLTSDSSSHVHNSVLW